MMYLKIHESYRYVVALCDKELMGKKFEEGKMQLEIKEYFFKGNELAKEEIIKKLKKMKLDDATFNIIGKKSVQSALEAEIITQDNIGTVQGVPFALVLI